ALMEGARRATRLLDFGGDDLIEPLQLLTADVEKESKLTALGRFMFHDDLLRRLCNRLRIEDWIRRDPGILQETIERPVFIVGLPRSGTTYLHPLLAADPTNRVPSAWEMDDPVPPPEPNTYTSDRRIQKFRRGLRLLYWIAPSLHTMHEIDAQMPEE